MADQNSFDVVSEVDMQEVKNALDQTAKELQQRFDFKGSKSRVTLEEGDKILVIVSDDEAKLKSVIDILQTKFVKRGISLKALDYGKVEQALAGTVRQRVTITQGIASEKAKEISKAIRDGKFKVQAQIQGDQLRVTSKSRDELQTVIAFLKDRDFGIPVQFTNYR
ncbi:MAG: YajQ family cyclic di-GMP-binding protein [Nitrospirae bacterium]|nr:YajQ family cyclic di-GMP-binding protein [Nitrospirota bacterium]